MTKKYLIAMTLLTLSSSLFSQEKPIVDPEDARYCLTSREYITSLQYLRKKTEFMMDEPQMRLIADKVSKGCTGAGRRFIQVTDLLTKAGLDSKSAVESAVTFSLTDNIKTHTFTEIFKEAFQEKSLDLDLLTSLKLANSLSLEFSGDVKKVVADFHALVKFCTKGNELDLPKQKCAELASKITKAGEPYDVQISDQFFRLFEFLTNKKEGGRSSAEALSISERIISKGHVGVTNFIHAFRFAKDEKGLNLSEVDALKFSEEMTVRTTNSQLKK